MALTRVQAEAAAGELVDRYCPNPDLPGDVRTAAVSLAADVLAATANDVSMTRFGSQSIMKRDPMRGGVLRRSGAAGLLAGWRIPRAVAIGKEALS